MTATAPALDADLVAGLKRLKLATIRAIAPEMLLTAKTQRWKPEDLLRTLIEAEIAAGQAAVAAGMRVRYFAAADLVETLYRGLADNSVAKIIDNLLRAELVIIDELGFAPLDLAGTQLLFRFVAAAYERRSLGVASHWPFDAWGRFLPEHTTAASMLDRLLHHAVVVVTEGESYRMREAKTKGGRRKTTLT